MNKFIFTTPEVGPDNSNEVTLESQLSQLDTQGQILYRVLAMKIDEGKSDIIKQFSGWSEKAAEAFTELESKVDQHNKVLNNVQIDSGEKNVIIHGLDGINYDWKEIKSSIVQKLNPLMELDLTVEDIYKVYVLGKFNQENKDEDGNLKRIPPIKIRLIDLRTKVRIMKKRPCLKNTQIYISDDLPKEVRDQLKAKRQAFKERNENKKDKNKRVLSEDGKSNPQSKKSNSKTNRSYSFSSSSDSSQKNQ